MLISKTWQSTTAVFELRRELKAHCVGALSHYSMNLRVVWRKTRVSSGDDEVATTIAAIIE